MLHTNFQGHRYFGFREEHFLSFLPTMGMAARAISTNFRPQPLPHPIEAPYEK